MNFPQETNFPQSSVNPQPENNPGFPNQNNPQPPINPTRHRRSKHDPEGRIYNCQCGKSFLSKPALNNHIKTKHPETLDPNMKRGRGRPRKYPPKAVTDFENTTYPNFFSQEKRKALEGKTLDNEIPTLTQTVFDDLYKGEFKDKLFFIPNSINEEPILKSLINKEELDENRQKSEKNCNEVFYEYLKSFKDMVNDKYFILLTKFVILFRECYDLYKNKDKPNEERIKLVGQLNPDSLPDLCNEFYGEFLEPNDFFGINNQEDRDEIINLIQHFCIWLFKNDYTKSKLSLASS